MHINYTVINNLADFQMIIESPFIIPKPEEHNHFPNMWVISLDTTSTVSIYDFSHFIYSYLQKKVHQLQQLHITDSFIFYMWFDEMAGQLRLNIIPKNNNKLPFACHTERVSSVEIILQAFLNSHYHDCIPWSELNNENTITNDTTEESPYTLKVFIAPLTPITMAKKL